MSGNLTPVYDSLFKKNRTTRRRIFKDKNGDFKEKLEIKNCEKRTIFGSLPFEGNSNWKLDDLTDIEYDDVKKPQSQNAGATSSDKNSGKSSGNAEASHSDFNGTIQTIINQLKEGRRNRAAAGKDGQGFTYLYEKNRDGSSYVTLN